uniref:Uncharacterized protein n=1 Tax=Arundo donax TaxID=35708 RepID=A0A0A9GZC0_ARUDO
MPPGQPESAHAASSGRSCRGERSRPSLTCRACAVLTSSRLRAGRAETAAAAVPYGCVCSLALFSNAGAGADAAVLGVTTWCDCAWERTKPPTMLAPSACTAAKATRRNYHCRITAGGHMELLCPQESVTATSKNPMSLAIVVSS